MEYRTLQLADKEMCIRDRYWAARGRKAPRVSTRKEVMRSMRSRVPEKSELAAQLKRYRYDAGLKGDEAGAVIGKKATTVYKYEAGTLWVSPGDLRALLNEYGVNMVTAFTEVGDPRAGGRKKDESALRWRKMRAYYDMMGPAKQRTLLDVARAMAEDF